MENFAYSIHIFIFAPPLPKPFSSPIDSPHIFFHRKRSKHIFDPVSALLFFCYIFHVGPHPFHVLFLSWAPPPTFLLFVSKLRPLRFSNGTALKNSGQMSKIGHIFQFRQEFLKPEWYQILVLYFKRMQGNIKCQGLGKELWNKI